MTIHVILWWVFDNRHFNESFYKTIPDRNDNILQNEPYTGEPLLGEKPNTPLNEESKLAVDFWNSLFESPTKRLYITSVITNSTKNCTALNVVRKIYDYIKENTKVNNTYDPRIHYQINVHQKNQHEVSREICIYIYM